MLSDTVRVMLHHPARKGRGRRSRGSNPRGRLFRARRRDDSGAALIEAAIILPVLMVFLLGIIEFGLVYATGATATGASRSGARLAATAYAPAKTTSTTRRAAADQVAAAVSADLKNLTSADPIGMVLYRVDPNATDGAPVGGWPGNNDTMTGGCTTDCFRYSWSGNPKKMTWTSGDWAAPDACGTTVDNIGVYVLVKHHYLTGLIGKDKYVGGKTVMRMEPLPTDQCS